QLEEDTTPTAPRARADRGRFPPLLRRLRSRLRALCRGYQGTKHGFGLLSGEHTTVGEPQHCGSLFVGDVRCHYNHLMPGSLNIAASWRVRIGPIRAECGAHPSPATSEGPAER